MVANRDLILAIGDDYRKLGADITALRELEAALKKTSPKVSTHADVAKAVEALRAEVNAALDGLFIRNGTNYEDTLRNAPHLYERLSNIAGNILGDYAPTQGQRDLTAELHANATAQYAVDDQLLGAKLDALNAQLKMAGVAAIVVKRP
jgi:hypothetical protein